MPAILSASFAIGAFEPPASSTSCIIFERAVSAPTRSARILKYPDLFIDAPVTLSPAALSTGILSPVINDSSTDDSPSTMTPSTGTLLPGFTISISPTLTSSTLTSFSSPFLSTTAVSGAISISFDTASVVLPLLRASRNFPTVMSVSIVPADSKYISI